MSNIDTNQHPNRINLNGITFMRFPDVDPDGVVYICENCEKLGIRTTIKINEMSLLPERDRGWYRNVLLKHNLEEHSRQHQNPIVQHLFLTKVLRRKEGLPPEPEIPKPKPKKRRRRMIQT
jgi:hypothetical protein